METEERVTSGRLCLTESTMWARIWCQELETDSAEFQDEQVEEWAGLRKTVWGERVVERWVRGCGERLAGGETTERGCARLKRSQRLD